MLFRSSFYVFCFPVTIVKFISTDANLFVAVKNHDWNKVASLYNGAGYKALALKIGREPYDISLKKAYIKYSKI